MSTEKNAEIWSTRLQKELLALTTTDSESETQEVAGVLPPFIKIKSHELDIGAGICKVSFLIDVPVPAPAPTEQEAPEIVICLDASMMRKPDNAIDASVAAYPFLKPTASLALGAERFPEGSTIANGNAVDIDCDWTPSLHLTDAVLNVGLKVKESLLQGEPFHPVEIEVRDPVDDLMQGARRFGAYLGKSAKNFVDKPKSLRKKREHKVKKPPMNPADIKIGDTMDLLESPWVECEGLYSCKAIRRPAFVEDAMFLAAQAQAMNKSEVSTNDEQTYDDDGEVPEDFGKFVKSQAGTLSKAATSGFAGASSMLRSFTASAKSVLEESFLMITETHVIELRSSKLNLSTGTVTFAISIDLMAKLKFRRQESISLFFKPAPDDPLIFMCPDSASAVHQIQNVLKNHGVKGKHTNAATQKAIHEALQLVQEIQAKERALEYQPSLDRVNEIMDLYRQAAERFELAGDVRHEEVVTHMRKFLAQPLTASILDGSFKPEEVPVVAPKPADGPVPEGEVLERTADQLDDDDESVSASKDNRNADFDFEQNIDSVLKEAKADLDKINTADGSSDDDMDGGAFDDGLDDLDAMMASADAELADIMAS